MQASPPHIRFYRVVRVVTHVLYGLTVSTFILGRLNHKRRNIVISRWSKQLLNILNVQIKIAGRSPSEQTSHTMFVANHVSWLDIHALNSIKPVRFIAKAEVARWPIFGWLAKQANTLFIERTHKKDTLRVNNQASESLRNGDCFCYFPEGTTTDGTYLMPFKPSLMQAAIDADAIVWPFTILYPKPDGSPNVMMAFAGETTLIESIWQIISLKQSFVEICFLENIKTNNDNRRALTNKIYDAVTKQLKLN